MTSGAKAALVATALCPHVMSTAAGDWAEPVTGAQAPLCAAGVEGGASVTQFADTDIALFASARAKLAF